MRIDSASDGESFAAQIAALRRFFNTKQDALGEEGVAGRMMRSTFLPFLTALRVEIHDDMVRVDVMNGVAALIEWQAKAVVQSLYDEDVRIMGQTIEDLLKEACFKGCRGDGEHR